MALARFEGTATNEYGDVVPYAYVEVRREEPGRPVVPLWADRAGTEALGNPIQADEKGQFGFHCIGGAYYIRFYTGTPSAPTLEYIRRYQAIGTAAERDVETLAGMLEAGTATYATLAELEAFTPAAANVGGKVTTGAGAGFYHWDGDEWIFDRPLNDTLARFTVTGGTADAVVATLDAAIAETAVVAYVIKPGLTNTGAVTINGKALLNVTGEALSAGEFPAGRLIMFTDEGESYQMLSDPAIDALLAQAIELVDDATALATPGDATVGITKLSAALAVTVPVLSKADLGSPCLAKTGAFTVSVKAGTVVRMTGVLISVASDTAVTMPSPTVGYDYVVFAKPDGTFAAVAWTGNTGLFGIAPAYPSAPTAGAVVIGGFHYAPGDVPAIGAQTGGTTTPSVLATSIWDLKFRPECPDPRAKARFGKHWMNCYRLGVDHHINGPSRHGVVEANGNGGSRPKRPIIFGGDGTALQILDWWAANEIAVSHGQRLPTYEECCAAFFGVVEGIARGISPVTTGFDTANPGTEPDEKFTSWCGVFGATGCRWVWCSDPSYAYVPAGLGEAYFDITGGRGKVAHDNATAFRKVLAGGKHNNAAGEAGSRCYDNANGPQTYSVTIGARFVADHFQLD